MTTIINYKKELLKISATNFIINLFFTYLGWLTTNIKYEIMIFYYLYGFIPYYIHILGHKHIFNHWFKQHTINHHIKIISL